MLDLSTETIPVFKLKINGEVQEFDPLELSYKLRGLEGVEDPTVIREEVSKVLGIKLDTYQACRIVVELTTLLTKYGGLLKKVLKGPKLSSARPTGSRRKKLKTSVQENTTS